MVIRVGPTQKYKSPSSVARLVRDGDTVEIAAGIYEGDVASWRASNLTLRGVGGRAHLKAMGRSSGGKAIWVIKGDNNVVENIEFSGARVRDLNGAGIRLEGTGLTIRNSYFHDNQMGILTGRNLRSDIVIEGSEFANNTVDYKRYGRLGHNIYIGRVRSFTLRNSYVHDGAIGHNVKSRARVNRILYNRLMDRRNGSSSYIVDLPNGGTAYLIGNVMQQSRFTDNWSIINFASVEKSPDDRLYLVNNTMVSERDTAVFVQNRGIGKALLVNNILVGKGKPLSGPGRLVRNLIAASTRSGAPKWVQVGQGKLAGNLVAERAGLREPRSFDYRLVKGSPAIDAGAEPKPVDGEKLAPKFEYRNPLKVVPRKRVGKLDIGAYEIGG
jgi:Right handed beta helix region